MAVEGKDDTREVFVSYQAIENQRLVGVESVVSTNLNGSNLKKSTRPTLGKQTSPPSSFLSCFSAQLALNQKHKYMAVHQTYMAGLFGQSGRVSDVQEAKTRRYRRRKSRRSKRRASVLTLISPENYNAWHKIELQSEHWQHNQVTLYVAIAHFRQGGKSWFSFKTRVGADSVVWKT